MAIDRKVIHEVYVAYIKSDKINMSEEDFIAIVENTNTLDNIYNYCTRVFKRKTLEEAIEPLYSGKSIPSYLPYKYPFNKYFYIKEELDINTNPEYRRIAHQIYRALYNQLLNWMTPEERKILYTYRTIGDGASFVFDIDEQRPSNINTYLNNHCFTIQTPLGPLVFEFTARDKYNATEQMYMAYEDTIKHLLLFVKDPLNITTKEVIYTLRHYNRLTHEFVHFISDMHNRLQHLPRSNSEFEYINDPDEFEADSTAIIEAFGDYLALNTSRFKNSDLSNPSVVQFLFNTFLTDTKNNVVDEEDLSQMSKRYHNWTRENKLKFIDVLLDSLRHVYNKNESWSIQTLTKLICLKEYFIK